MSTVKSVFSGHYSIRSLSLVVPALLVFGTVFLFAGGVGDTRLRSLKELWSLGHVGFFALLVYQMLRWGLLSRFSKRSQWLGYLLLTLGLGLAVEILQYGTGRATDWFDVSLDVMGCLLALAFAPAARGITVPGLVRPLRILAILLLVLHLLPFARAVTDETLARLRFPVLTDFDTPFELDRWYGDTGLKVVKLESATDNRQLQVNLSTARYSGAGLKYFPSDFSGYRYLHLSIYSEDLLARKMTLRIHDQAHTVGENPFAFDDRFHQSIQVKQGWNRVSVDLRRVRASPRRRQMDMTRIIDISLFVHRLPEPGVIYIDDVYLE